jgi:hypothetical protein
MPYLYFLTKVSSVEAEYRSMAFVTCELLWHFALLKDLYLPHTQPALIFCESQAALHIAAMLTLYFISAPSI